MTSKYAKTVEPESPTRRPVPDMEAGLRATARMLRGCGQIDASSDYELLADAVSDGLITQLRSNRAWAAIQSAATVRRRAKGRGVV